MINAYTLESHHIESDFFFREFKIDIKVLSEINLFNYTKNLNRIILIISDYKFYENFIEEFNGLIAIFLLSDENLDFNTLKFLRKYSNKIIVFRNYTTTPIKISLLIPLMISHMIFLSKIGFTFFSIFKLLFISSRALIRIFQYNIFSINQIVFPLGYTNNFSNSYASFFNLSKSQSLLDFALKQNNLTKNQLIADFYGSRGNNSRMHFLQYFNRKHIINLNLSNDFMGLNGNNAAAYLLTLLKSQYSVVPQGVINLESYRFYESILCQSVPLTVPISMYLPTLVDYYGDFQYLINTELNDDFYYQKKENLKNVLLSQKKIIKNILARLNQDEF